MGLACPCNCPLRSSLSPVADPHYSHGQRRSRERAGPGSRTKPRRTRGKILPQPTWHPAGNLTQLKLHHRPTSRPLRASPPTSTVSSQQKRQLRLLRRCPTTSSHRRPPTATSGLPAIGPGARLATTGCPGAWVEPPYAGALWTPGYWGFYGGRYSFYPGYWGLHIGFYGGINYGFGYIGLGYEGGYWHSGHFFYNSVYNHIDTRVVHNVYRYNAGNRARAVSRASFNGGRGVQVRPRSSEMAARREPTAPRMSTQVEHARTYSTNRGQFAAQNHGRPATPAISRGIPADRNVRPTSHGGGGQARGNHK